MHAGQFIRKYFTAHSYAGETHPQDANYSGVPSLLLPRLGLRGLEDLLKTQDIQEVQSFPHLLCGLQSCPHVSLWSQSCPLPTLWVQVMLSVSLRVQVLPSTSSVLLPASSFTTLGWVVRLFLILVVSSSPGQGTYKLSFKTDVSVCQKSSDKL